MDFYRKFLESFASDKESGYPHIIFDNDFTMPSRTRALLFDEKYDEVVQGIAVSYKSLMSLGVDYIFNICGTAHVFLPEVFALVPGAEERTLHMINELGRSIGGSLHGKEILILAAEGALKRKIFQNHLKYYGIKCIAPDVSDYPKIRFFIDNIKKNQVDHKVIGEFTSFIKGFGCKYIVLGCTELPIIVNSWKENVGAEEGREYHFIDPLDVIIDRLHELLL